jgi:arylsulfatase A-like enzyme
MRSTTRLHAAFAKFIVFVASAAAVARAAEDRPNVVFFFTDDQRADTIAGLGNAVVKTPHLDRLVQSGFVFRNAYCMGSTMPAVCNPSRHMMLSGKSLFHYDPQRKENTFGDVMRRAGYVTYHHSKRGNSARVYHTAFERSHYLDDGEVRRSGHHGKVAADDAIAFLEQHDGEKPFFMYVGFAGPHDPRVAAPQWTDLYDRTSIPLPANYMPFHPFDNGEMGIRDEKLAPWPRTEEVVRRHLHDYYACISSIDHQIGRVLAAVERKGWSDKTIVVFSSDHGLAIGSHGLFGKQNLYEHSMKSPLIFKGPGIPHGETEASAYLFDIFPTVCDLTGVPAPEGLDGKSQAPVIHGQADSRREAVFLAYRDVQRAVRLGRWKLIRYPKVDVTQLFDLRSDPDEMHNLADKSEFSDQVDAMLARMRREQQLAGDTLPLKVDSPTPAEVAPDFFKRFQ